MTAISQIAVLALAAFIGNAGVAITGFGMAIIYWLVIQVADISGYPVDVKHAIFVQSLALFAAQPILLSNANPRQHATRSLMELFIPITLISTPLGQLVADYADVSLLQLAAGILVSAMSLFEIYKNRALIISAAAFVRAAPEAKAGKREASSNEALVLGKYRLVKQLGTGTQAVVMLAERTGSTDKYAMKIIEKAKTFGNGDDSSAAKMNNNMREATLLKTLRHPNIIGLEEVIEQDERWYLVMELVSGGDLFERLSEDGAYDEATAQDIMKQLLTAVEYMHSQGIIHRDLKPENIMLAEAPNGTPPMVKIADFGLATRINAGRAKTFCGTPIYCAPEVTEARGDFKTGYGKPCDLWGLGVICFNLLAGFHPFDEDSETPVHEQMKNSLFNFNHPAWENVSEKGKSFIRALLQAEPAKRLDASAALAHEWLEAIPSSTLSRTSPSAIQFKSNKREYDSTGPVFMMIGSQRSGSNWLRTMLDEREDLASPHPPHIMRDFMPLIDKFGDLDDFERLRVLIDHVCYFVEQNQVPWLTIHGQTIAFSRKKAERYVSEKLAAVREKQGGGALPKGMHLLSVFDFIYSEYANSCDKRFWICKSMGMSKYHHLLLQYYGEHRLRYLYLVRDPRDVAMSFMKTPVGDCHYYPIITKWCGLQDAVVPIMQNHPDLVLKVNYEELLSNKKAVINRIYDFIGKRRYGMGLRKASVLGLDDVDLLVGNAKSGKQALSAAHLSKQFKNLMRGESFAALQHQKWLNGDEPMSESDLILIESVAHEHMVKLGYQPHIVPKEKKPTKFTEADLAEFERLNQIGIKNMMATLEVENPGDAARRKRQAAVLSMPAELITLQTQEVCVDIDDEEEQYPNKWPQNAERYGYLPQQEVAARLTMQEQETVGADGTVIRWAALSQAGYYPTDINMLKKNQDAFDIQASIAGSSGKHWAAVFDGHGGAGDQCSNFAKVGVLKEVESSLRRGDLATVALRNAHLAVNKSLHEGPTIDDEKAGTTSVCMLVENDRLYVSYLGDSSCLVGKHRTDAEGNDILEPLMLTKEHALSDPEESKRIKDSGGCVIKDSHVTDASETRDATGGKESHKQGSGGGMLRVYSAQDLTNPGTAFSRSIGDAMAESLGVWAEPDIEQYALCSEDRVLVLCSDGITDFIPNEEIMKVCSLYQDPAEACRALVGEAYKRWMRSEDRSDDITIIIGVRQGKNKAANVESTALADTSSTAFTMKGKLWTLSMGFASGFLGGLCGIRGPPIILYFLHSPLKMSKAQQKGNGAAITAANVLMRIIFYAIKSANDNNHNQFSADDIPLYILLFVASIGGVAIGQDVFQAMKDSQATIKTALSFLLVLSGISLLMAAAQ